MHAQPLAVFTNRWNFPLSQHKEKAEGHCKNDMVTKGGNLQHRIDRLHVQQLRELRRIQTIQRRARQRNRLARPRRLAARALQLSCRVLEHYLGIQGFNFSGMRRQCSMRQHSCLVQPASSQQLAGIVQRLWSLRGSHHTEPLTNVQCAPARDVSAAERMCWSS